MGTRWEHGGNTVETRYRNPLQESYAFSRKPLILLNFRFHYDWETNRSMKFDDYFSFPRVLDMGPYTVEGITAQVDGFFL